MIEHFKFYQNPKNLNTIGLKEIIIVPRFEFITNHFKEVATISEKLKQSGLTQQLKSNIEQELKKEFRDFSKEFVEILYSVDRQFADDIQLTSDECLDKIQHHLHSNDNISSEDNFKKVITDEIITYRNKIIGKIYLFEESI